MYLEERLEEAGTCSEDVFGFPVIVTKVEEAWTLEDHLALRDYLEAHALLEGQPDALPESEVPELAARLDDPRASTEQKKRVLIFLAHQRSATAVAELAKRVGRLGALDRFARLACDEARQWVGSGDPFDRNAPCACGSGRKLKACCGRRRS